MLMETELKATHASEEEAEQASVSASAMTAESTPTPEEEEEEEEDEEERCKKMFFKSAENFRYGKASKLNMLAFRKKFKQLSYTKIYFKIQKIDQILPDF